ncbi:MAG: glutamate synthase large subunit [Micavibrio sp.]|nr:glutamate synthase large subunit [Micavibrio sp.]
MNNYPAPNNTLYNPDDERDSCGVGFVAAINGQPRRDVVEKAIGALKRIWHRGAVDADGKTGDGAGLMVQIPQKFFRDEAMRMGHSAVEGLIGVGQLFLPRIDMEAREKVRSIVETELINHGYRFYGWRQVPIDVSVIGSKASATRPEIEQILIGSNGKNEEEFEHGLYMARRRIEKAVRAALIQSFHVCSMSSRAIVYKGLFLAEQLSLFYPDLQDARFESNFAMFHQRYSTNTFPSWPLAQPFRTLAHNGEINTLRGNLNWLKVHETRMDHARFDGRIEDLKPVVDPHTSDSGALDSVFELLCRAGRDAPMAKSLLIPEADPGDETLPKNYRAFYKYCNTVMEPWDGPAALALYDGRWIMGGMDRNGLRPFRYTVSKDGLIVACSETGMVTFEEDNIVEKSRIGPGEMIGVDLVAGKLYKDRELKDMLAARQPFEEWVQHGQTLEKLVKQARAAEPDNFDAAALRLKQIAVGVTQEDIDLILKPMVTEGKEALGSMGSDTPLAVFSQQYRGLHHFFHQNFAQVTNPPIDSLRETRVMSVHTRLGNLGNILDEDKTQCQMLALQSPVLTNGEFDAVAYYLADKMTAIDTTFPADSGKDALKEALSRIRQQAADAVRAGKGHIVLTDTAMGPDRAAIPAILAVSAVHTHLIREGLRSYASVNVRSAECLDVHHFAVLVGVGATTVNAWLVQNTVADGLAHGLYDGRDISVCMENYRKAVNDGLRKIMSKMGISIISAYRGGCNFEAIGLSRAMAAEYLAGIPSRISGIGLDGLQRSVLAQHQKAFAPAPLAPVTLPVGGFYRFRDKGEHHNWEGRLIHALQGAVNSNSFDSFKRYTAMLRQQPLSNLRDLLDFNITRQPLLPAAIEPMDSIRRRFVTPSMSLGALSLEAHGALNIAMNRIGAKSASGEGGEDPARYKLDANGNNPNSAIKQIASGRFGVTAEYLNQCREIEIKVAQGAKPGEGGQLPGFKVTEMIARFRHSTPGVMLISPPPHHDIYSIEDLAQLIYDLKQVNPTAKVCVKLVARAGIGTIAAGVVKAKADVIHISGNSGGTGASPQSSIKFAGIPWEMGIAEVHQVLVMNNLRDRVTLRTDGGIKSGRDIVIAAILGAEEFGIGTASLIAMGCLMVRQCHSNTCPVGICTQDEKLREFFTGTPEKVINLFSFIAEEVREILAQLGYTTLNDVIGRTELLRQTSLGAAHLDDLDLNSILAQANADGRPMTCTLEGRNPVADTLDIQIIEDAKTLFTSSEKIELTYPVENTHRAVGTRLSSLITRQPGAEMLPPDHITVTLQGSAGQSLGAFAVQGIKLVVEGDANDYVGKGLSGGTIVVRPPAGSRLSTRDNTIIGNTVLYGATSGKLFAAGQAGERFAVRNSGAKVVIEGCGSNGCEYMTGGIAVILGATGPNFGAGMTGGMAYLYDPDNKLDARLNKESIISQPISIAYYEAELKILLEEHLRETRSPHAAAILNSWETSVHHFRQIIPNEMTTRLTISPFANSDAA